MTRQTMGGGAACCEVECVAPDTGAAAAHGGLAERLAAAWALFRRMLRVRREREHLARLDESQLLDLGITSEARRRELARPFWDIP